LRAVSFPVDASKARTMAGISTALAACLRAYSGFSNSIEKPVRRFGSALMPPRYGDPAK